MLDITNMPETAARPRAKLYCHACGRRIHPDSRFCRHCGENVPSAADDGTDPLKRLAEGAPDAPGDVHHDPNCEVAVWQGRPAWRAFGGAWAAWFSLAIMLLYAASRFGGGPLVQAVWLIVGGAAVGLFARDALVVYGLRYHLTTQRLFVHRGILTRVTDQMELIRVDDVRQTQGVLDRILDTGTVQVFSTDETDDSVTLRSIPSPADVAEQIRLHTRGVRNKGAIAVERI